MIALVLDILSWISILIGSAFCLIGGIGLLRLPDVFARMHAAGIVDSVGVAFIVLGLLFQAGWSLAGVKLLLIVFFVLYTSPVSTHALAQAAVSVGAKPWVVDEDDEPTEKGDESSKTCSTAFCWRGWWSRLWAWCG